MQETTRLVRYAFAGMLLLFGAAAVLAVILPMFLGLPTSSTTTTVYPFRWFGFGWIWLIFGFFFVFWVARWIFWPWRPFRHGYYRHWGGGWYGDNNDADGALTILRRRYARGELTREQFEQMKADLQQHNQANTTQA